MQSESAVRHLANSYAYDHGEAERDHAAQRRRRSLAGAARRTAGAAGEGRRDVEEARLTHLAYAPEIARAMLRRQQAEAIIAARQKIVHGAVSMVQMALQRAGREASRRRSTRSARRRWSATCWSSCAANTRPAGHQHRHAVYVIPTTHHQRHRGTEKNFYKENRKTGNEWSRYQRCAKHFLNSCFPNKTLVSP